VGGREAPVQQNKKTISASKRKEKGNKRRMVDEKNEGGAHSKPAPVSFSVRSEQRGYTGGKERGGRAKKKNK